jgi:DNA primase small subunit
MSHKFGKDDLELYYSKMSQILFSEILFPFNTMYQWLSYGNASYFYRREFSFTIDDVYLRYRSYKTEEDFEKNVLAKIPNKIDIGPVYTVSPSEQHSVPVSKFVPESKEYVLDIDISDYDNVRWCGCKEAKTCGKCWKLMTCGAQILDHLLENVFGCKNRLWVFSGRRGIHCWVCDPKSRNFKNMERTTLTEFMQLYRKKISLWSGNYPIFALDSTIYKIAEKFFLEIFCDETLQMMDNPDHWKLMGIFIQSEKTKKEVFELLEKLKTKKMTFLEKWEKVKEKIIEIEKKNGLAILELVYSFVYPRLDENVSKHLNHLLKSPWSIHPSTGNICVPFNVEIEFDVENPPNISVLHTKNSMDVMSPYLNHFATFCKSLTEDKMDLE